MIPHSPLYYLQNSRYHFTPPRLHTLLLCSFAFLTLSISSLLPSPEPATETSPVPVSETSPAQVSEMSPVPVSKGSPAPASELYPESYATTQSEVWYTESGHVEFTSSVPLHEFTGTSDHLTGMIRLQDRLVDFYLDLKTLKTGNGRRDHDMYSTLDTDRYPFAEFTGQLVTPISLNSSEVQTVQVEGEMTIHGITRPMRVDGTIRPQGDLLHLQAEWILDITDYQIKPPGILFYRVRDKMDVRMKATLSPSDQEPS